MWVFYLISLPLTLGMVFITLRYFAGPDVPRYVLFTVGYTWFCSLSIIILVPADIWTTIMDRDKGGIAFFWSWSYWSTFALTWAVVPTIQGYEDAGDFTLTERLKTSIRANLVFYLCIGSIGLFGLILLIIMKRDWSDNVVGLAMACSNTFGLVTGAFLLGFGLSEIPKSIWRNADWSNRQKNLSHRVAKMAVKLDDAHQEFSNAIVVAQATSNQMSKRDPLRPCMDVIDSMVRQLLKEDPSFKPSGGRLGENDMDYDTDEKTMATLRRQLRRAREEYYRYKRVHTIDLVHHVVHKLVWRCILRKQLEKVLAVVLGCMSVAILLAEATLLPNWVDLSLFSILIKAVGKQEMLVQIAALVPLMYMCIGTYYSLFKIGMLMFYSFTARQTNSVSLLMICSMVARYAAPISYNFLNLIRLGGNGKTIFEKRMGNIDDAVSFFGRRFNRIYPLIMSDLGLNKGVKLVNMSSRWPETLTVQMSIWNQLVDQCEPVEILFPYLLNKRFLQGISSSEKKVSSNLPGVGRGSQSKILKEEDGKYVNSREIIGNKYSARREQQGRHSPRAESQEKNSSSLKSAFLIDAGDSQSQYDSGNIMGGPSSRLSSTWLSMKTGFQNFKANMEAKKFLPLRQVQETRLDSRVSSSESLDEIFQRLKQRPTRDQDGERSDDNSIDDGGIRRSGPTR
ncbi:hypothetical protein ACLOJK_016369 [Asimina triloba]